MIECAVEVTNPKGLHTRPAARFASVAAEFDCDIRVTNGEHDVSGKSIMGMMILAASPGTELRLTLDGADAREAVDRLRLALADDIRFTAVRETPS